MSGPGHAGARTPASPPSTSPFVRRTSLSTRGQSRDSPVPLPGAAFLSPRRGGLVRPGPGVLEAINVCWR